MHSYVLRVYRLEGIDAAATAGTLESIETGKRVSFHSGAELLALLKQSAPKELKRRAGPPAKVANKAPKRRTQA